MGFPIPDTKVIVNLIAECTRSIQDRFVGEPANRDTIRAVGRAVMQQREARGLASVRFRVYMSGDARTLTIHVEDEFSAKGKPPGHLEQWFGETAMSDYIELRFAAIPICSECDRKYPPSEEGEWRIEEDVYTCPRCDKVSRRKEE